MISQKNDIRYSCHRIFMMALSIIFLMAMGGIIGCSNSSGSGDSSSSGPSYHMIGYGEPAVGSSTALLEVGNSGLNFLAQAPWFVNMTFQVSDEDGVGIPDFKVSDFNVFENGTRLDTVESNINIRKRDALPPGYTYTLKTVLFIDNSANIAPETLNLMMDGAKAFLSKIDPKKQQEFAVVAFNNDGDPVLIHDFTSQAKELIPYFTIGNALVIKRSFGTANFYGAIQFALDLWKENPSPATKTLTQGFVVVLTEGRDTTGLYNIDDAIAARDRDNKRVVSVPIGPNIPAHILAELERLGNGWYYPVPKPDLAEDDKSRKKSNDKNLVEWMTAIQERIIIFADSFYWIQYKSEQSGAAGARRNHNVEVAVAGNSNPEDDAKITGTFSSKEFITGEAGVYFNATAADPSGTKEVILEVARGQEAGSITEQVSAITYSRGEKAASKYTWTPLDESIISVSPKSGSTAAVITAIQPGETTIRVADTANGVSENLVVKVVVRKFSYEIVQHEVESAFPWFVDATFQVRETDPSDNKWKWITDMKREEFLVYENKGAWNETLVDRETSEVHLRKRNRLPSTHTYTLKTVLLIDNSPSVDADGDNLALMKQAAKAFVYRALVNNPNDNTDKGPLLGSSNRNQQQIAIYSFTEAGDGYLVQDFTSNLNGLNAAIDRIPRGFGPIDFYRGMINSLGLWQNDQSPNDGNSNLQQGFLVVLSDGWTASTTFFNKEAVIGEIKDKQVICVGVSDDLVSRANLNDMKAFANAGYYSIPNPGGKITQALRSDADSSKTTSETITNLSRTMRQIQDQIVDYANSFYWLNYKSYADIAAHCANTTELDISITQNSNTINNRISDEFETCNFFKGIDGKIYVNSTVANPGGVDNILMQFTESSLWFLKDYTMTVLLNAVTYNPNNPPNYTWSSSNRNIAIVDVNSNSYAKSSATIRLPDNPQAGFCEIQVMDKGNANQVKRITVQVERIVIPQPPGFIAQRLTDLYALKEALEAYYADTNKYPETSYNLFEGYQWQGLHYIGSGSQWIPGLVPAYVPQLPRDPRNSNKRDEQYIYKSDGSNYKLIAQGIEADCDWMSIYLPEMLDPVRPCFAYGFWTKGASDW